MIIEIPGPPTLAEMRRALAELSSVTPEMARQMVSDLARINAPDHKPRHRATRSHRSRRRRL